ncbi:alpha/beta hydrolase [Mucilaginibacter sp. HMF5004]|uniref:alpha/beta hydrolase n=1 Tax=Mucilaginibacter rivuli TaxID=2857527 RepID=UPI001C5F9C52|nr:alpha/beta hydrolase [Mucilaginibacter rivuli]MBW4891536.1 alpha/beta hydrolase [Mucilaginibacter rivuli]
MSKQLLSVFTAGMFFTIVMIGCNKSTPPPVNTQFVCPANRFTTETFTYTTTTIPFGQAADYKGKLQTLQMLINLPSADTLARRPLIIYCHGGGFTSGTRTDAWPNKFCQSFAKRGYVTASIDYRLGIGTNGDIDVISAQTRAVQDAKAAVRYFKQTAVEQGNPYRIDTAQIFIAGEASGAAIALQMGYLTNPAEFTSIADADVLVNLNGIEGNSNTAPYSSKITGIISLSGAILNLNWIPNKSVSLIMVHGSNDTGVPYKSGIASPYTATMQYGSYLVDSTCISQKMNSSLYTFKGAGAAPYISSTKYADSTIKYVSQQLYHLIDCERLGRR